MGLVIALLGTAVGVLGGNPMTRRVLEIATHGRVRDGVNGGIILDAEAAGTAITEPVRRGRRGHARWHDDRLPRAPRRRRRADRGLPEAIAIVVAIKGVGRFSELAAAEARERFIIGTLSSLLWACVVGRS